jgi:serine phosphatase RsbU (regulator of sigma subunit)
MMRALVEVGAAACAAAAGWGAGMALTATQTGPALRWGAAAGIGVALSAFQLALVAGARRAARSEREAPIDARRFLHECATGAADSLEKVRKVTDGIAQLFASSFRLGDVHLFADAHPSMHTLDPRVRTWLVANDAPIATAHLEELRLGGLREPILQFLRGLGGDLVMPLVHRDRLLAVVTARGPAARVVRGDLAGELRTVQLAAVATLGELRLRAEADHQAGVAREVEAAATVQRETAPATTSARLAGCRVVRHYAPARQFSGAWWCARELPDGRLFAGIGEVTGRGAAAALLSATAMGVCESATRWLGGGLELHGVLELLHRAVRGASRGAFAMSAVVALVDVEARIVTFAGAGHPFPFLVHPAARGREGARGSLRSLVSRGSQLGAEQRPQRSLGTTDITPGDVLVFFTASLTDARDQVGTTFGERRLQHILRRASLVGPVGPDGSDLVDQVADEVAAHVGGRSLDDDVLIATVHLL